MEQAAWWNRRGRLGHWPCDDSVSTEPWLNRADNLKDIGCRHPDRSYGLPTGTYVSPAGTHYPMRALPPGANLKPYAVYQVSKPLGVEAGVVRPWFGQPGLGFQYKLVCPPFRGVG